MPRCGRGTASHGEPGELLAQVLASGRGDESGPAAEDSVRYGELLPCPSCCPAVCPLGCPLDCPRCCPLACPRCCPLACPRPGPCACSCTCLRARPCSMARPLCCPSCCSAADRFMAKSCLGRPPFSPMFHTTAAEKGGRCSTRARVRVALVCAHAPVVCVRVCVCVGGGTCAWLRLPSVSNHDSRGKFALTRATCTTRITLNVATGPFQCTVQKRGAAFASMTVLNLGLKRPLPRHRRRLGRPLARIPALGSPVNIRAFLKGFVFVCYSRPRIKKRPSLYWGHRTFPEIAGKLRR